MKKASTLILATAVLLSSCATTSDRGYLGTMAGADIGGAIGEAIGWMSTGRHDGPGKAMLGSIIGTVAGAVIGHELATQGEKAKERRQNERNRTAETRPKNAPRSIEAPHSKLVISNVNYQDEDGDGRMSRNETVNVIFDVKNISAEPAEVTLSIDDPRHEKELAFSPANTVTVRPGQSIRYKAKAFSKSKIKDNYIDIQVMAQSPTAGNEHSSLRIRTGE